MISTKPQRLCDEIRASESKRDLYLSLQREVVARYHGPGFLKTAEAYVDHENHAFEWCARYAAELIQDNPRATVKGYGDPASMSEASSLEQAANRDIRHSDLARLIQDTFPDWSMFWNVTVTTVEPQVGEEDKEGAMYGPYTCDVDRDDVVIDASAKRWADVRLVGHRIVCDKEDLVARAKEHPEEGWDLDAIMQLKTRQDLHRRAESEGFGDDYGRATERGEVEYWQVFLDQDSKKALKGIPKSEMYAENGDKLYNGTLCTVSFETTGTDATSGKSIGMQLRPPRPYFGPPSDETIKGPYVLHGCYRVPGHVFPLSPVLATYHQQRSLNDHVDRMLKHAKAARTVGAVDGLNTDDNERLKNAEDGAILVLAGLDKNRVASFAFPGTTQEDIDVYQILKNRRNENAGMGEAERGNAVSGVTATADTIAGAASSARTEFCAKRLVMGWKAVIKQRVWFLRNDYRVSFHLENGLLFLGGYDPEKAIRYANARGILKDEEADFYLQPEVLQALKQSRVPWGQLDISIDIYSMQRTSEAMQQHRITEGSDRLIAAAPVMLTTPHIEWKKWATKQGEGMNWPDYGELVNEQILAAAQQATAEAAQAEQAGPPQGSVRSPKTATDLSGSGSQGPNKKPTTGTPGNSSGAKAGAKAKGKAA